MGAFEDRVRVISGIRLSCHFSAPQCRLILKARCWSGATHAERRTPVAMLTCSELKKIPLFACLNNVNLVWLSQQAADLYLKPGEYLIHEGEPTPFFAVMEGSGIPRIG